MKGILLPCGVTILLLGCAMMVTGFSKGGDVLEKCGISKDKDATLHACLTDYKKKKMDAWENIRNSATKNYTVLRQLFQESLRCFPADKKNQRMCYIGAMYRKSKPGMPKRGKDEFSYGAAAMYYQFKRATNVVLDACDIDEKNSPKLFECLKEIDPKAKEIIRTTKTDVQEGFEKMAALISTSKKCYVKNINAKQGECLLEQNKVYQKNLTERMQQHGKDMVEKLQKCGVSKDIIGKVMGCTKPKADEMIKLALELYEQPEKAGKVWELVEEMKSCIKDYPEIKKCLMRGGYGRPYPKRQPRLVVNPFHFEKVTAILMRYIQTMSGSFIKRCDLQPQNYQKAFLCFKKKHDAEKDIDSKDPKKAFIAMMHLMNTTASCFDDVELPKKECLAKGKDEMMKTVNDNSVYIGVIMDSLLKRCNAPSEINKCVDAKEAKLTELAKTLLTDPAVAEKVWANGASLKDCLKTNPAVEKCVLSKNMSSPRRDDKWRKKDRKPHPNDDHVGMMKQHLKEKSMKMLAECKLTPQNAPAVFQCFRQKFKESMNETSTDPKQMFMNGMKLIKSAAVCLDDATKEQKLCIEGKKKEMKEMISEKSKLMEETMDKMLEACGVSESKTPDLVKCYGPKRAELKKLVPKLFDDPAIAESAWDLMEGAKKCFENKTEVMKCIKEKKSNYWMGKGKPGNAPKMNFMEKVKLLFKKCGVHPEKTPDLNKCLQAFVRPLTGLFYRRDMDTPAKMEELKKLAAEAGKCFEDKDEGIKQCLKKGSAYLKSEFMQRFKEKSPKAYDPKNAEKQMDEMYSGCGITKDKTPELKSCLDERTRMVMQLKPWLPMSPEVREKLKAEGRKYWKCFADDKHDSQLKCMRKIIDGFRKQGKSSGGKPKEVKPSVSDKDIKDMIDKTKAEVLACSKNKCFQEKVEDSAAKFKNYFEKMTKRDSKKGGNDQFRRDVTKETVVALFCLRSEPADVKQQTFSCLKKVIGEASDMAKNIKKRLSKVVSKVKNKGESWGKKKFAGKKDEDDKKKGDEPKNSPRGGPRSGGKRPFSGKKNGDEDRSRGPKRGSRPRNKRDVEDDDDDETMMPFFPMSFDDQSVVSEDISSITSFELIFNAQSVERVQELFNLINGFMSKCPNWARPQALQTSNMIDMPERADSEVSAEACKVMSDQIISFINTGHGSLKGMHLVTTPEKSKHKHDSMIIALCTGSVAVGILVLLTIIVIFVTRRRCKRSGHQTTPPVTVPTAPCAVGTLPPVYTTYPTKPETQPPPSYSECLDTEKYEPAPVALSQILTSSTSGESTEKSC